jgi:pimeloyl-ACP methyl ester carboxylesterase
MHSKRLFWLGWLAILLGSWLAHAIQTADGVAVRDVRFTGSGGKMLSGLLYVPAGATAKTPAPGILAVHGYINSRETQSGFAVEYARRGYVVLALDQSGHGFSDGPAFSGGFGGPAGLRYLRELDIVDAGNIGMEGHSMGGGAILAAARAFPDGYKSMVLEGSATQTVFSPPGTPTFPRNLAVVFSRYDEFSQLMWGVERAADVNGSAKLKKLFGTDEPVATNRLYGSLADGTARTLYTPSTTHPGDHFSRQAIGDSIEWFERTLKGGKALPRGDQIWMWKELGTLVALGGFVALLLGTFDLLLGLPVFANLRHPAAPAGERRGSRWWLLFALTAFVPVATFYSFMHLGARILPASKWLPQGITNQLVTWAVLNAAIAVAVGFAFKSKAQFSPARWRLFFPLAFFTAGVGYLALLLADYFFKVDFRFWVVALKPLSAERFAAFIVYLVPFTAFFMLTLRAVHGFLCVRGDTRVRQYLSGIGALALGFVVFIAVQYLPLFTAGHLLAPSDALNAIISLQFLPLMVVVALIGVFTWRRTHHYAPGAMVCGLFITWYVVAGTATHVGA